MTGETRRMGDVAIYLQEASYLGDNNFAKNAYYVYSSLAVAIFNGPLGP